MRTLPATSLAFTLVLSIAAAPAAAGPPCDTGWHDGPLDNGALPSGVNHIVRAAAAWDPDGPGPQPEHLVIGGKFTQVQGLPFKSIAMWNPQTGAWQEFGYFNPLPPVEAIKVLNGELFIITRQVDWDDFFVSYVTTSVRRWSTATESWMTIASFEFSEYDFFLSLGQYNGELIVGGMFTMFNGDQQINSIARWTGTEFLPLGQGVAGRVNAMMVYNGELIVGGDLEPVSDPTIQSIARWNGTSWQGLGSGITEVGFEGVNALAQYGGELIAGGGFLNAGGAAVNNIARWNGSAWHGLGLGVGDGFGFDAVCALTTYNGELFAGGEFLHAGGVPANGITRWDGTSWQPVGGGLGSVFNPVVFALTKVNNQLIAGGEFTAAGSTFALHLARWNGTAWSKFGGGTASAVFGMTNFVSGIVAGGLFQQTTGEMGTSNIVSFDGVGLRPLGPGMNDAVNAVTAFTYPGPFGEHELIAGGWFTAAGGVPANFIARWQEDPASAFPPPAWEAMGAGFNNAVMAIERFNGQTYAGGVFTQSGATAVSRIARWNESNDTWQPLLGGLDGTVYALKEYNGALYVGGAFLNANGTTTGRLARWNGTSWSTVTGIFGGLGPGVVYALEVYNGDLIIGGDFGTNLVKFNSVSGQSGTLPNTFPPVLPNNIVRSLKSANGKLYVGGEFTMIGNMNAAHVAVWNGTGWAAVDGGADSTVYALGAYNGEVHAGGLFNTVDSTSPITSKAWARLLASGVPWFAHQPVGQNRNCGADVTFVAHLASGYMPTSYQWRHDGVPLVPGSTPGDSLIAFDESSLTISNLSQADAGAYDLVITNACGSVTSMPATLNVIGDCPACPADIDDSDSVNVTDLLAVINGWGTCPAPCPPRCPADITPILTGDCAVNVSDLLAVINAWGPCP